MNIEYENDFYGWTQQQVKFLRNKEINLLDWANIAEEIEAMGKSEKRELESRLEVLIMHLLKWQYQPNLRSRSWQLTIKEERLRLEKLLKENPSFKAILEDTKEKIYPLAVISAEKETGLSYFPESCPYLLINILSRDFLPDSNIN
ncbi:DUF29 domain-containing protein [Geminocystis sp. CENA526]|uniref:DUF29 domain-containing protein n=1 Tax=Geminocystis sp. CENA526 TaxID=1355871 RepID=UPI003D6DEB9C